MRRIKFTKDCGTKRPGDVCEFDGQLARQLVDIDKVAEDTTDDLTPVEEGREYIEPTAPEAETEVAAEETVVEETTEKPAAEITEEVTEKTPVTEPAATAPATEEVIPAETASEGDGFDMDTDLTPKEEAAPETPADDFAAEEFAETVAKTEEVKPEESAPAAETAATAPVAKATAEPKAKKEIKK